MRGGNPLWAPWTPEHDAVLCQMRSEFPVETFDGIAKAITVIFGITRTRHACLSRWHRIETEDTAIVRRAVVTAELREKRAQDRLYRPETPWDAAPPPLPPLPDTLSLPRLKAAHPPPPKPKPKARWYRDPEQRRHTTIKIMAERVGITVPPLKAKPHNPPPPRLVMRVPTLAELDLQRPSMR